MNIQKTILGSVLTTAILLTGCAPRHPHPMGGTTLGRQLIDLKEAHDKGALTDQEFVDMKMQELKILQEHVDMHEHEHHSCGAPEVKKPGACGCHEGKKDWHHEHDGKGKHKHICNKEK